MSTDPKKTARLRDQDRLVLRTTAQITETMEAVGMTQAELARRLGKSRAPVAALLSGGRNMTLRTLADVAHALGLRAEVSFPPPPARTGAARLGVSEEALGEFCRRHHIRKLSLFGSVLRDDFGPDSDVDVLVEFEPGNRLGFAFFGVQDELSALLGRTVDLNTPQDLSRYFRDSVVREAEVIYDADAAHAA